MFALFMWQSFVCFYSSFHEVQMAERAQARISKGKSEASSPRDYAGRRISHRPSHPLLYSALAGGQRVFTSAFRAVRKPSIVCGVGPPYFMPLVTPRRRRLQLCFD